MSYTLTTEIKYHQDEFLSLISSYTVSEIFLSIVLSSYLYLRYCTVYIALYTLEFQYAQMMYTVVIVCDVKPERKDYVRS